jgi:hypothetical protein
MLLAICSTKGPASRHQLEMVREVEGAAPGPEPSDPALEFRRALWRETTKIIVDTLYSGRSHQKAAARWSTVAIGLGLPAAVITAASSAGAAVSAVFVRDARLTAGLALVAAVLSAARAFLKPDETFRAYEAKGAAYIALRNDATQFRDVRLRSGRATDEELESELNSLHARRNALNLQQPIRVPTWAYKQAKASLAAGESDYKNDPFWEDPPF